MLVGRMVNETKVLHNFIDGEYVDSTSSDTIRVSNPATSELIARAPASSGEDVDRAVKAARHAFDGWSTTRPAERALMLNRLADAFERNVDEFVDLEVTDVGKPVSQFQGDEVPWILDLMRYYAGAARHVGGINSGEYDLRGEAEFTSIVRREPIGVIGQIISFDFPTIMTVWKVFPALAAGNTVVFKPSEHDPLATLKLAELGSEFLPKGVFNVVTGAADTAQALVTHDDVDMVSFTGSTDVGRWISRHADIKRLSLGLSNQAPAIVLEDADLEFAISRIARTAYYNAGQDCAAATRVLVAGGVYDEAVNRLVAHAEGRVIGDLFSWDTTLGPLIAESYRERVEGFLARRPEYAELLTGGTRPDRPGFYLEPAVVTGLRQEDELIQQEIYGPVITVQPFANEEEAIALANGTRYGLTGSVWTQDLQRAVRFIRKLKLGNVNVNVTSHLVTETPFGGFKQSGYGHDTGMASLEGYTQIKNVTLLLP
jgi:betaine-aldehyde dehydrogenase